MKMREYKQELTEVYSNGENRILAVKLCYPDNTYQYRLHICKGDAMISQYVMVDPVGFKEIEQLKSYVKLPQPAILAIQSALTTKELKEVYTALTPGLQKDGDTWSYYVGGMYLNKKGESLMQDHFAELPSIAGSQAEAVGVIADYMGDKPTRQLVILWALSAVLCGRLGKNFLLALVGTSSTGKTTALKVAQSLFCQPDYKRASKTWASTLNALLKSLDDIYGFPMIFDDTQLATRIKSFSSAIYELYNGYSIERLSSKHTLQPQSLWNTSIGITAERSLLDTCQDHGVLPRLLEISVTGDQLFDNAAHANEIQSQIKSQYGTLGTVFARYILEINDRKLTELYGIEVERIRSENPDTDGIQSRCMESVALISLTAKLASEALALNFDRGAVETLMVSAYQLQAKRLVYRIPTVENIMEEFSPFLEGALESGGYLLVRNNEMREFLQNCRNRFNRIKDVEIKQILEDAEILIKENGVFSNTHTLHSEGLRGYKVKGGKWIA